jgi:hypothetical protein
LRVQGSILSSRTVRNPCGFAGRRSQPGSRYALLDCDEHRNPRQRDSPRIDAAHLMTSTAQDFPILRPRSDQKHRSFAFAAPAMWFLCSIQARENPLNESRSSLLPCSTFAVEVGCPGGGPTIGTDSKSVHVFRVISEKCFSNPCFREPMAFRLPSVCQQVTIGTPIR